MAISVKNYTNRFLIFGILLIMAIWALLFYAVIMDEVYDNIDDGLKNQKILILREVYIDSTLIEDSKEFGINQFRILPSSEKDSIVDHNIFSKELIYMPYDEEDEPYRILRTGFYDKLGNAYRLEIRTSTVEEDDFLINLAISLSVLYLVIVISIMIINHFVLKKAWKPFHKILQNLSRYKFGDAKSFQKVDTRVREFNELNDQIHLMIQRNEDVFRSQKRFIENASHELQTPLTVVIGKLDMLLDDENLSEAQLESIVDTKKSLFRMRDLNKSLLMLSRIENRQYMDAKEVDFGEILTGLIQDMTVLFDHQEIHVILDHREDLILLYNEDLARVLISNLLRNALKYNYRGGTIAIEMTSNQLKITNTSNVGALNPQFIFERFYKGKQDSQSNGLGLSIVSSILTHNPTLTLSYDYEQEKHVFLLTKK